jgi:hypothetical protein
VHALAGYLKDRGYQVLLDQDHLERDASNYHDVPAYIARMVDSDVFLAVVTERYLDLVEVRQNQTSWVFDEYQSPPSSTGKAGCRSWRFGRVVRPTIRAGSRCG